MVKAMEGQQPSFAKQRKAHGGLSDYMNTHKATISNDILDQEDKMQVQLTCCKGKRIFPFF